MRNKLTIDKTQLTKFLSTIKCLVLPAPLSIVGCQLSILTIIILMSACNGKQTAIERELYTCSMHPQVVKDKPGTCPICGMDLVRKSRPGEEVKITKELSYLLKPTNALIASSISTITPVQKTMEVKTEAKGIIAHDTRKIATISARFGGRIEKLYVKYNLQPIQKGQKILEIYSPDLLTAQRELLYLLHSDAGNWQLIELSKQKLRLLGLSETQINQLVSAKQESYSFAVYSEVDGYVMEHSMSDRSEPELANSDLSMDKKNGLKIREGIYVTAGESLFTVVSHADLWAEVDLYQRDVSHVKLNQPVLISIDNTSSEAVKAKIDFIQPFFKNGEDFTKVRMYLSNPHHHYHAGQIVTATFTLSSQNALWIPVAAKLDLGKRDVAFVKRRGGFRPMAISTGHQSGEWIEVLGGLEPGDSIAYNAQFMVDSESFIKVSKRN